MVWVLYILKSHRENRVHREIQCLMDLEMKFILWAVAGTGFTAILQNRDTQMSKFSRRVYEIQDEEKGIDWAWQKVL